MGHYCGIGVDIVEHTRIRNIRYLERFAELVLSKRERAELAERHDKIEFIASRFAAKEAVIKAFPAAITSSDFEIRKDGVKPYAHFFDARHRICQVHVSLSHSSDYAAGYALAEMV